MSHVLDYDRTMPFLNITLSSGPSISSCKRNFDHHVHRNIETIVDTLSKPDHQDIPEEKPSHRALPEGALCHGDAFMPSNMIGSNISAERFWNASMSSGFKVIVPVEPRVSDHVASVTVAARSECASCEFGMDPKTASESPLHVRRVV